MESCMSKGLRLLGMQLSLVFAQAANRLPTEQAVIYALTTGEWE